MPRPKGKAKGPWEVAQSLTGVNALAEVWGEGVGRVADQRHARATRLAHQRAYVLRRGKDARRRADKGRRLIL